MATVIAIQPTSAGPAAGPVVAASTSLQQARTSLGPDQILRHCAQQMSSGSSSSSASDSTSITALTSFSSISRGPGRNGASCDACLRRKSRCAMNELINKCYSCDFHRQDCTFTLSNSAASNSTSGEAQSRKRKLEETSVLDLETAKRYDMPLVGTAPG